MFSADLLGALLPLSVIVSLIIAAITATTVEIRGPQIRLSYVVAVVAQSAVLTGGVLVYLRLRTLEPLEYTKVFLSIDLGIIWVILIVSTIASIWPVLKRLGHTA